MSESITEGWARWITDDPWEPPPAFGRGWDSRPAPVPLWEKRFCAEACGFPWKRLCALQRFLDCHTHKGIFQWDDSAAAEALRNAKARFYAEYHGHRCGIPLPDPDMFIDEVDHDAVIDLELIADVDRAVSDNRNDDEVSVTRKGQNKGGHNILSANWNCHLLQAIQPSGWEDAEEPQPKLSNQQASGGGENFENCTGWGCGLEASRVDPWESGEKCILGDHKRGDQWGTWVEHGTQNESVQCGTWEEKNRNFQHGKRNGRKRGSEGSRWGPIHTRPKYQNSTYKSNDDYWRNSRGSGRGRGRGRNWTANHTYNNYPNYY